MATYIYVEVLHKKVNDGKKLGDQTNPRSNLLFGGAVQSQLKDTSDLQVRQSSFLGAQSMGSGVAVLGGFRGLYRDRKVFGLRPQKGTLPYFLSWFSCTVTCLRPWGWTHVAMATQLVCSHGIRIVYLYSISWSVFVTVFRKLLSPHFKAQAH
jgi:hypothetical protein